MSQPAAVAAVPTVAQLLLARLGDGAAGVLFEDRCWTWDQHVHASIDRGAWLQSVRLDGPFHVGLLLDNVPEFSFVLGAAALAGAVVVGLNPTRRGRELERDIAATDCQLVLTESRYFSLLSGLALPVPPERIVLVDEPAWDRALEPFEGHARLEPPQDADALLMLIFTSGTSGEPKAVRVTHRKVARPGLGMVARGSIGPSDVAYLSMPMFHSGCVMQGWAPALVGGATMALRRRFSASNFLPDVRRLGVTYFHYVGKPLAYILATPERPDDADNPLRVAAGNEAAPRDIERFASRFDCEVEDGFGSTEGGVYLIRTSDTPSGSLGLASDGVDILNPSTGTPVPSARFDPRGRLLNADEAIGELVNASGPGQFAGYYRDEAAEHERMRDGRYWSGDLAYRDQRGFVYFAGRTMEWLRVDGENLGAAPIERVLSRYDPVDQVAVYAVPDPQVGDQVMAALVLRGGQDFDPAEFSLFLANQGDLGTKWAPRYVRIASTLPMTETNKVLKRLLAVERWTCDDPIWVRDGKSLDYRPLADETPGVPLTRG